jgi:hypothetical protein
MEIVNVSHWYLFALTYFNVVNLETKKTVIVANPEEFIF